MGSERVLVRTRIEERNKEFVRFRELRKRHIFELREILLDETHPRYAEFSERVPVTVINNDITFDYRIPEEEFLRHLISLSRTSA